MANTVTLVRIVCSIAILFIRPFSAEFYVLYTVAGISDMLDGHIARKLKTASDFGARLDSISDIIFICVCTVRLLLPLQINAWLWASVIVIAMIRAVNILSGIIMYHKLIMLHTAANKITGAVLFAVPFVMPLISIEYIAVPVCMIAAFSAIEEGHLIRTKQI